MGQRHNTLVLGRWLLSVLARLVPSGRRLCLRQASGMFCKEKFWAWHHFVLRLAPTRQSDSRRGDRLLRLAAVHRTFGSLPSPLFSYQGRYRHSQPRLPTPHHGPSVVE